MISLLYALASVIFIGIAGCSFHTQPPPALHDFGVQPTASNASPQTSIDVEAPEWLESTKIRYRLLYASPTQVRSYTLDRWIAPPAKLLEQELEASGSNLGYPIKVNLLDFEQQFDRPGHAKALMSFTVTAYTSNLKTRLGSKTFRLERVTATPDAEGAVNAFSELSRRAAGQVEGWLSGLEKR